MDPATAYIAGQAAAGFGKALGEGVARQLFGGGDSRELRAIQRRLEQIFSELKVIESKLDNLINAVDALPAVIMAHFDQKLVDNARRYLESAYVIIRDSRSGGRLSEPPMGVKNDLLHAWTTVVDLESRPKELMQLPFWTEFVRAVLLLKADATFAERLMRKKERIDGLVAVEIRLLDAAFDEARAILQNKEFTSYTVSGDSPYFSFVPSPVPQVIQTVPIGPREAERRVSVPDRAWIARRTAHEKRLNALREIINARRLEYNAQFTCQEMLRLYLPVLNRGGSLQPSSGWSGTQPAEVLSLEP